MYFLDRVGSLPQGNLTDAMSNLDSTALTWGDVLTLGFLTKPCMRDVTASPVTEDVDNVYVYLGRDDHCVGGGKGESYGYNCVFGRISDHKRPTNSSPRVPYISNLN